MIELPLFGPGGWRATKPWATPQKKDPAPRFRRGGARWAKDSAAAIGEIRRAPGDSPVARRASSLGSGRGCRELGDGDRVRRRLLADVLVEAVLEQQPLLRLGVVVAGSGVPAGCHDVLALLVRLVAAVKRIGSRLLPVDLHGPLLLASGLVRPDLAEELVRVSPAL